MNRIINKRYIIFPILTLLFITLPVYSTMETADPGAESVLALVIPTLLFGLAYLKMHLRPYHASAFFMWLICSVVTLVSPFSAETNLMQIVKYLAFVLFFIVVSNYRFTGKDIVLVTKGYLFVAILVALLIILSYLGGYQHFHGDSGGSVYYMGRYSIGITGLFKNPNYLASFICVAALVVMYKVKMSPMTLKKQLLFIGVFLLFFISCFLTGTRISLIVLFIIMIALYGTEFFSLSIKGIVIPVLLIGTVVVLYGRQLSNLFDLYLAGRDMLSDEGREQAWPLALHFFYDNFIVGCGIDSWHHLSHGNAALKNLHNVFLEFLLNQGIVGLILILHIVLFGYNRAKKRDRFLLYMLLLVTALPLSFQNGVVAVNFWRFVIINRLALNYSIQSKDGLVALFKSNQ